MNILATGIGIGLVLFAYVVCWLVVWISRERPDDYTNSVYLGADEVRCYPNSSIENIGPAIIKFEDLPESIQQEIIKENRLPFKGMKPGCVVALVSPIVLIVLVLFMRYIFTHSLS